MNEGRMCELEVEGGGEERACGCGRMLDGLDGEWMEREVWSVECCNER